MSSILGLHEDKLQLTHGRNVFSGCLASGLHFFSGYFLQDACKNDKHPFQRNDMKSKVSKTRRGRMWRFYIHNLNMHGMEKHWYKKV